MAKYEDWSKLGSEERKSRLCTYFAELSAIKKQPELDVAYAWFQSEVHTMLTKEWEEMPVMVNGWKRGRDLLARCEIAAENYAPAGKLLHALLKRWRGGIGMLKRLDGAWAVQTRELWCFELNLSESQYKEAVRVLKATNLCEFAQRPLGGIFKVTHARPTAKALVLLECFDRATAALRNQAIKLVHSAAKNETDSQGKTAAPSDAA